MGCDRVDLPGVGPVIVCSRSGRRPKLKSCAFCSSAASLLCDYPVTVDGKRRTCDCPLCDRCTTKVGKDSDLCRTHAPLWRTMKEEPA